MDVERFGASCLTLIGIVTFFHGVEGLIYELAPKDCRGRALFGAALFVGSVACLVLSRGFVNATGYDGGDDSPPILPRPRGRSGLLRRPLRCGGYVFHADVWAVATLNGVGLCAAWAGLDYVLDAAPALLRASDAAVAVACVALGNGVLVANRQLYAQFHSRLDLGGSHVLEPASSG